MTEVQIIFNKVFALLPYVVPTIVGLSIIAFADLIYGFMFRLVKSAKRQFRW